MKHFNKEKLNKINIIILFKYIFLFPIVKTMKFKDKDNKLKSINMFFLDLETLIIYHLFLLNYYN